MFIDFKKDDEVVAYGHSASRHEYGGGLDKCCMVVEGDQQCDVLISRNQFQDLASDVMEIPQQPTHKSWDYNCQTLSKQGENNQS